MTKLQQNIKPQTEKRQVIFALPAFNEADNLPNVLAGLNTAGVMSHALGFTHRFVVVDDGSSDSTIDVLREWQGYVDLEILRHQRNLGLGATIQDALAKAVSISRENDVVVTLDADGTHPAGLTFTMLLKIVEGCDVVIASRYRYGARVLGLHWHRHLMSVCAALLFKLLLPIPAVRDYTCGFRAYKAGLLARSFEFWQGKLVTQQGFQCMPEIILRLRRADPHAVFGEVPMVLRYYRKKGKSKMRVIRTVLGSLKLVLIYRFGMVS